MALVVNLLLSLAQVPIVLSFWDPVVYGGWLTMLAVASVLTSLDVGHHAFVGGLLNRLVVEDPVGVRRVVASAVRVSVITGGLQVVCALILFLNSRIGDVLGIANTVAPGVLSGLLIYTVAWTLFGSVAGVLVRLMPPRGHFVRSVVWSVVFRVSQFGALAAGAAARLDILGVSILYSVVTVLGSVFLLLDLRRVFPEYFPWWKDGSVSEGARNLRGAAVLTGISVLESVGLQGVVVLVGMRLGPEAVAIFATIRTVTNVAMQGSAVLLGPVQPDAVRFSIRGEVEKRDALFQLYWVGGGGLANVFALVAVLLIEPTYRIWTQGAMELDLALFGWLMAAVLLRSLGAPLHSVFSGMNCLRPLGAAAVARCAVSFAAVWLLAGNQGLAGVGAALFAAEFIAAVWIPYCYRKEISSGKGGVELRGFLLASGSAAAGCLGVLSSSLPDERNPLLIPLALVVVAVFAGAQWRFLPVELRERVAKSVVRMR